MPSRVEERKPPLEPDQEELGLISGYPRGAIIRDAIAAMMYMSFFLLALMWDPIAELMYITIFLAIWAEWR
jgi:hypothetical protein